MMESQQLIADYTANGSHFVPAPDRAADSGTPNRARLQSAPDVTAALMPEMASGDWTRVYGMYEGCLEAASMPVGQKLSPQTIVSAPLNPNILFLRRHRTPLANKPGFT